MHINWPRLFWGTMHYWSLLRLAKAFICFVVLLILTAMGVLIYDIVKNFT